MQTSSDDPISNENIKASSPKSGELLSISSALKRLTGLFDTFLAKSDLSAVTHTSVRSALRSGGRYFGFAALFSGTINILMLSGSLFMLQVYDRVIPSHSMETLVALVILVVGLHGITALLEGVRSRLFARIGRHVDISLREAAFDLNLRQGLPGSRDAVVSTPFKDLDSIRTFLASGGPSALFDLPWAPLYLILLFLLHPFLGCLGLAGMLALSASTLLAENATSPLQKTSYVISNEATALSDTSRNAAETLKPLGMVPTIKRLWLQNYAAATDGVVDTSDTTSRYSGISRFLRVSLQSITLAVGAYLVITGKATGGVMIASSILLGKALAPIELAISHWRGFGAARQAYDRLERQLSSQPAEPTVRLPRPTGTLTVENVHLGIPGGTRTVLSNLNFALEAGDGLGILGPSGAGKSTLIRALVGLWPTLEGSIRIDGSKLDQWTEADMGSFTGYLAQGVELFSGTVGANISRFEMSPSPDDVIAAANMASVDRLVRAMPDGFDTHVGPRGGYLSAGQRQRIALARALYKTPFLLVLDEPNSALDAEGEMALMGAIAQIRREGGIVVVSAHKPLLLQAVNKVLVLDGGQQKAFGPRDEVVKRPTSVRPQHAAALAEVN